MLLTGFSQHEGDEAGKPSPPPDVSALDPHTAARVRLTVSCTDCDALPKVPAAGSVVEVDGTRAQVMHNGVLVEEGCYYGDWMTEIIRCLRGHHEPQEELVVARILERLHEHGRLTPPRAIELGSFWAYYLLWVLDEFPDARVLAMEPDPAYLDVGRRNFALNGRDGMFVHGAIGPEPGRTAPFAAESDGRSHDVLQYDLRMLMDIGELASVDLLLCDTQGSEELFHRQAYELLANGAVRFAVVSTHHHSISGTPLTHQRILGLFENLGAHIVCEHTVGESFSGDGLIVAAFDPADHDLVVPVSRARAGSSLFGALEYDLAAEITRRRACEAHVGDVLRVLSRVEHERDQLGARAAELASTVASLSDHVAAIEATKTWRWSSRPRSLYRRLRRRTAG